MAAKRLRVTAKSDASHSGKSNNCTSPNPAHPACPAELRLRQFSNMYPCCVRSAIANGRNTGTRTGLFPSRMPVSLQLRTFPVKGLQDRAEGAWQLRAQNADCATLWYADRHTRKPRKKQIQRRLTPIRIITYDELTLPTSCSRTDCDAGALSHTGSECMVPGK